MNKEAAEKLLELIGEVKRTAIDCGFAERGYDILCQKEKEEALTKAAHDVAFAIAAETEGSPKWQSFKKGITKGRWLPPVDRCVLVQCEPKNEYSAAIVAVGYLTFAAGDKNCPYFVTPGIGGEVVAWSDCLGDDFKPPLWAFGNTSKVNKWQ